MLNARIRKRWRAGNFPIGLIGEKADLTYSYDYLGAGAESLADLAKSKFADALKAAERPLILIGAGALARKDGAAIASLAAKAAVEFGALKDGWNGFCVLHSAASRVGALDLGLTPGAGGQTAAQMAAGGVDVLFLLGADEIEVAPGAFVIYIGTHGDRGAHRADVILPGAAYPEKSAIYVNTEGRVQMATRAAFPPGDAREDWAILRALSGVLGHTLPYDSLAQLRQALFAAHPHFMRIDQIAPADAADIQKLAKLGGAADKAPLHSSVSEFYLTNPIARASATMAECSALANAARQDGGGVAAMEMTLTEFFFIYVWPLIIILAECVLLLVFLLVAIAYVIYADRKIWAAVQMRRGPNVVGPWGLFQSFADMLKFALKEPTIPAGANKGVFLLAPLVSTVLALAAWAVIPVNVGWVIADINVGVLYIFAISSLMVYGIIMAGWASNSKYPFLSALRAAAQMVSYEVSIGFVIITVLLCAGSLNLTDHRQAQQNGIAN